jgi:hypothetical protein
MKPLIEVALCAGSGELARLLIRQGFRRLF